MKTGNGNSAAFQFTAFLPESFEISLLQAGLLAYSGFWRLPVTKTVAKDCQKLKKSLQQRELPPIYTGFPIKAVQR
jgi:hypothetical protein